MHVDSAGAVFLAGLGTGAHCALMCGPLACALRVNPVRYQATRLVSYVSAGALCGGAGQLFLRFFKGAPAVLAPWLMLGALLVMALGLEKRLPTPAIVARVAFRVRLREGLGWVSPLLPCGPLWLMLGVAASSGSTWEGAGVMLLFALGTLGVYVPLQLGWGRMLWGIGPVWMGRLQKGMVWFAAGLMVWRMRSGLAYGCCCL